MVDMSIMELPASEAAEGSSSIVPVFGPDDEAADDEEDEAEFELDSLEESDKIEASEGGGLRAGGLGRSGGEGLSSMRWSLTELCDWVAAIMCWVGRSGGATYGAFGLSLLWGSEGGGCWSCRLWVSTGGGVRVFSGGSRLVFLGFGPFGMVLTSGCAMEFRI